MTPLSGILRENLDKEKRKVPQFLYFHNDKKTSAGDNNVAGEDIGFEDNNQVREAQARAHAKLLDSLLQDVLTGKFRDTHWFTGINVRLKKDTHWQHGVLKDRMDKYIDGADLARLFREKLQPSKYSPKKTNKSSPGNEDDLMSDEYEGYSLNKRLIDMIDHEEER